MALNLPFTIGRKRGAIAQIRDQERRIAELDERLDWAQANFDKIALQFPIQAVNLGEDAVDTVNIADDAVIGAHIADGSPNTDQFYHGGFHVEGSSSEAGNTLAQGATETMLTAQFTPLFDGYYETHANGIFLFSAAVASGMRTDFSLECSPADLDGRTARQTILAQESGSSGALTWQGGSVNTWWRLDGGTTYTFTFKVISRAANTGTGGGGQWWDGLSYLYMYLR